MTFPPGLRALNHPEYRRLYLTQLISQTGGWIQAVAQSWLVLQLTGSPLKLGLISTLQFAPVLLFSIVAGAVADRLPKRRVLIASQTTYLCQALALSLLVWTGAAQYWQVCGLALVLGFASVVDQPVRQSFIVELVGREDLGNAIALNSASFNAARIHGLPVPNARGSLLEQIHEGLHFAWRTPLILAVLGILTVVSLCVFNFSVYVPLLARTVLGLGAEGFGFLMASLGVGAVAGALTVATLRQPPLAGIFAIAAIALGGLVGLSTVRHFWTAVPLLFVTGFFGIMVMASCNARLQTETPSELRGRVIGIYVLLSGGVFPIGAFLVGAISERWSVSTAFLCNGTGGLTALGLIALAWRRRRRR